MEARIARRALVGALGVGVMSELLLDRFALGINVPILTLAILGVVTWFSPRRRPADPVDWWLGGVALLASLGPALRTDPTVIVLDVVLVVGGIAGWSLAVAGIPVTRRTTATVIGLGIEMVGAATIGIAMVAGRAGADGAFARGGAALGRVGPLIRGLAVAIPVLGVFTLLFASADAVFGRGLEEVFRQPIELEEAIQRGVFVGSVAWLVGGMIAIAGGAYSLMLASPGREWQDVAAPGDATLPARRGATEALTVLGTVDVLFAVFAAVQVIYLFGGADTLAAIGMTYSDYARQGYFQLVAAVALAGLLLLAVHTRTGRSRAFLLGAGSLLGLIALILGAAALRLRLYQEAYGWTELRFYVAASILWLTAATILAAVLLWRDRIRWIAHGLAASAVAMTLGVSLIGPHAFVTHENLARVLDPTLVAPGGRHGFDAEYAVTLSDDAVPELVAALDVLDTRDAIVVRRELLWRRIELQDDPASAAWQSWNLAREQARAALAAMP